jgi:hypothetical protein
MVFLVLALGAAVLAGCGGSAETGPATESAAEIQAEVEATEQAAAEQRAEERREARQRAKAKRKAKRKREQAAAREAIAEEERQERRDAEEAERAAQEAREAEEAEEASASECDPNYAGACLDPYASDYDCAGGSGNGPAYTGPVTVVGSDHYGLDADGDGYGCE